MSSTESDRGSNPNFRINPDPNVCRIAPKILWIHYFAGSSHCAKFRNDLRLFSKKSKIRYSALVREMVI